MQRCSACELLSCQVTDTDFQVPLVAGLLQIKRASRVNRDAIMGVGKGY
ncbi:hypothetical protein [Aliidiomarina minuta]|nr:hypothetical protein [Aliidiomarina minuta]